MKLLLFPMLLLMAYACKPHYDFSKIRSEVKSETKSDSLVYETHFTNSDGSWTNGKEPKEGVKLEGESRLLQVATVDGYQEDRSPCGALYDPYSISTKVKIMVEDSADLGYAGLCFDRMDENYYRMLYISNKGTFYLKDVYSGEQEILIPKIPSRYLNKGRNAWNTIEIRHRRKEIRILFNGNVAAVCQLNAAFSYGSCGLIASTTENKIHYSPVKAVFESFVLKKIKAEANKK